MYKQVLMQQPFNVVLHLSLICKWVKYCLHYKNATFSNLKEITRSALVQKLKQEPNSRYDVEFVLLVSKHRQKVKNLVHP
jgi:hypothetical protein